mmetsp:Transcript_27795/g.55641  ORF Transcript_27795/g.55641 Transcript_27795/m.55641 type:complete len:234 (-) Transcript_27795:603-1304(-)
MPAPAPDQRCLRSSTNSRLIQSILRTMRSCAAGSVMAFRSGPVLPDGVQAGCFFPTAWLHTCWNGFHNPLSLSLVAFVFMSAGSAQIRIRSAPAKMTRGSRLATRMWLRTSNFRPSFIVMVAVRAWAWVFPPVLSQWRRHESKSTSKPPPINTMPFPLLDFLGFQIHSCRPLFPAVAADDDWFHSPSQNDRQEPIESNTRVAGIDPVSSEDRSFIKSLSAALSISPPTKQLVS